MAAACPPDQVLHKKKLFKNTLKIFLPVQVVVMQETMEYEKEKSKKRSLG